MTDSSPERFTPARLASAYDCGIHLTRTPHERRDQLASWRRPDRAFFASGACHILAYEMLRHLPATQFHIETILPTHGIAGSHTYVTDGEWAFDFNGWSRRSTLRSVTTREYQRAVEGWSCEVLRVTCPVEVFCDLYQARPPEDFAFDPRPRARRFIRRHLQRGSAGTA